jgi:hypothetical protein
MLTTQQVKDSTKDTETPNGAKRFGFQEAKDIGEALGISWDKFDVEQFRMGLNTELEHGRQDPSTNVTNDEQMMTGKIAQAHLNEIPDYYTRLAAMEHGAVSQTISRK